MFVTIFSFGIIVTQLLLVTAKLPSYIHVCNRKDPNYDQCIIDNIHNVKDKICTGFPEFDIPPMEPIPVDKIALIDTNTLKFYLRDTKVLGFCDLTVHSLHTDTERLHFDMNVEFTHIHINTTYDFDMRLLVPLSNKGPLEANTDNLRMKLHIDLKVITKSDKKYIFASKVRANIDNNSFKYKFNDDKKELAQLHKVFSDIIDNNRMEIFHAFTSALEEKVPRIVISIFDKMAFHNYEELFPKGP